MKFLLSKHIFLVLLINLASLFHATSQSEVQQNMLMLRGVGNEFLLQLNDSTSRILPIVLKDGKYTVSFERNFEFEPDLLVLSVIKTFKKFQIEKSYLVEIVGCDNKEIVHSYKANLLVMEADYSCKFRALPNDCYEFCFTPIINESALKQEMQKSSKGEIIILWVFSVFILAIGIYVYFYLRKIKRKDILRIGKYELNKKSLTLSFNKSEVELSSKECELLILLHSNMNQTVEREMILNEIWSDEGNYVGRTLDVFISKLRKKLEEDPTIKIMNIRGIGYRLVIK